MRRLLCGVLLLCGGLLAAQSSEEASLPFQVLAADTQREDDVVLFNANMQLRVAGEPRQALESGVPLTVLIEVELRRHRPWMWDDRIAYLQQRYRIEYHGLARQYLATHLNSGELRGFRSLEAMLESLGRIRRLPLLDAPLLQADMLYYGRVRVRLDIEALPAPLRPEAWLSAEWRLDSGWASWRL